jgi:hypothetical protein
MANDEKQTADKSDADWEVAEGRAGVLRRPLAMSDLRPVRLVTARTILLAGMPMAFDDPAASLGVFKSAASHVPHRDFGPLVSGLGANAGHAQSHQ